MFCSWQVATKMRTRQWQPLPLPAAEMASASSENGRVSSSKMILRFVDYPILGLNLGLSRDEARRIAADNTAKCAASGAGRNLNFKPRWK
jgi:hypothetical protein